MGNKAEEKKPNKLQKVINDVKELNEEAEGAFSGINLGLNSIVAWRNLSMKLIVVVIILSLGMVIMATSYHFLFPLQKTEFLTVGYKVNGDKVNIVDIKTAKELEIKQIKLLTKYFIEDTIKLALSNYRDDDILKKNLRIASTRLSPEAYEKIINMQRQFEKNTKIESRQIEIGDSEDDGYGKWKLSFYTIDENSKGKIFKNTFNARIKFTLHGFNNEENMKLPVSLLKENPNPLGLKITGFYKLKDKNKEAK